MIGKTISHYHIFEEIGRGGMGVVYKAEDTKLRRTVAVKFLPPELTRDETNLARFLQEARAAAALNHPNVCTIHEIHDDADNPFIVMEYIQGWTLSDIIANAEAKNQWHEGRKGEKIRHEDVADLQIDSVINLAIQIAEALNAAHKKGIVHRDIKSDNMMITHDGWIKVMDFGLASLSDSARITKEISTLGTLVYMSPEHIEGRGVDARSDIFSFGVVLYEMLTGHLPFNGEYKSAIMYAILNEDPDPVQKHRSDLSSELLHVLNRSLEKDREQRYQSVSEVLIDLKRLKRDTGKIPSESNSETVTHVPGRMKKIYFIVTLVLILVAAISLYLTFWDKNKVTKPAAEMATQSQWAYSIAILPFEDYSPRQDQQYFCNGMTEEIGTKLAQIRDFKVIDSRMMIRYHRTDKNVQTIGQEVGVATILRGSIRKDEERIRTTAKLIKVDDGSLLWADNYDSSYELENLFSMQESVARAIVQALKGSLTANEIASFSYSRPANVEAYDYWLKVRDIIKNYLVTDKEKDFQQALRMTEKMKEIDPDYALTYISLAWIYGHHYEITLNEEDMKFVMDNCQQGFHLNPDLAETNAAIAWFYFLNGDHQKAYHHFQNAFKINPNLSEINHTLALFYSNLGLFHQAIKYYIRAYQLDPYYLYSISGLGHSYRNIGDHEKAVYYYQKCLEIKPDDPSLICIYSYTLLRMGKYNQAEEFLARVGQFDPKYQKLPFYKAILLALSGEKDATLVAFQEPSSEISAILGKADEAIHIIQENIIKTDTEYHYLILLNNPFYRSLHGHPEFQKLLAEQKTIYDRRVKEFGQIEP